MTPTDPTPADDDPVGERADVLDVLRKHRALFRHTVAGLTDEQARLTPDREHAQPRRPGQARGGRRVRVGVLRDRRAPREPDIDWANVDWSNPPPEVQEYADQFRMLEGETLVGPPRGVRRRGRGHRRARAAVDLDARQPLPAAPWFEPGASWSARRVFAHIVAETAQHAGHADIIRETIDGQKSMG